MNTRKSIAKLFKCGMAVLALVVFAGPAHAADGSWTAIGGGSWTNSANWGGTIADGADNTATFPNTQAADITVTLDADRTIGNITHQETSNHTTISGANILTLDTTIGTPTINVADNEVLTISSTIAGSDGLAKSGTGTLILSGANTYSGVTTLADGTLKISSDSNLGNTANDMLFNGSGALNATVTATLGAGRDISVTSGSLAAFVVGTSNSSATLTLNGAITGNGGIALNAAANGNVKDLILTSTGNNFAGPIVINNSANVTSLDVEMVSLADSAANITFTGGSGAGTFRWGSSASSALTLNNRQIELGNGSTKGTIENAYSSAMAINTDLISTGTGTKLLTLKGNSGGTFTGGINEGSSTLGLNLTGPWTFSGNNTFSGTTTLNKSATFEALGTPAMGTGKFVMYRNAKLEIFTDDAGTVNLGNDIETQRNDTSTGIIQNYTVHVDNNGGGTTGSTIVLGDVDFSVGDTRPPRQLTTTGANGYSVQVGDVILDTEMQSAYAGGAQRFTPSTASLEITGTVKQLDGSSGTRPNSNTLYLGGAMTGNLVSGTIDDADDYTNATNPNAAPLNVYKGDSGDWTLTGVNTYTGNTTIGDGTLEIGGAGQLGSGNYAGTITVGNGDNLLWNSTANQTLSGQISDSSDNGTLTKNNTGTLTLSANNSYDGGTTISGGTLELAGSADLGSGDVVNNAILEGDTSGTVSVAGDISGSGSVVMNGSGEMVLGGDNTYNGNTTVSDGKLEMTGTYNGSGTITANAGATFQVTGGTVSTDVIINGSLSVGDALNDIKTGTIENLTFGSGATYKYTMNGTTHVTDPDYTDGVDGQADLLTITGALDLGTSPIIEINVIGAVDETQEWVLFEIENGYAGSFDPSLFTFVGGGGSQLTDIPNVSLIENVGGGTTDLIVFSLEAFQIPEPSTMALYGLGGLLIYLRRRNLFKKMV